MICAAFSLPVADLQTRLATRAPVAGCRLKLEGVHPPDRPMGFVGNRSFRSFGRGLLYAAINTYILNHGMV